MALTAKQETKVKDMPLIETKISKSKDGKYLLHKTVITTIRPLAYYEAVLADKEAATESLTADEMRKILEA